MYRERTNFSSGTLATGRRLIYGVLERLGADSAWLMAGEAFNRGGRFLLLLLIARAVGAESFGGWVIAIATATILANAGDAGLALIVTRDIAADRTVTRRYLANLMTVAPVLALVMFGLLAALSPLSPPGTSPLLLLVIGISGVLESTAYLLLAPLRAHGRSRPEGLLRAFLGTALLIAGGTALFVSQGRTDAIAPMFPLIASVALVLAVFAMVRSFGMIRPQFDGTLVRRLFGSALPVFASTIVFFVYFRVDTFLLAYLSGEEATGLYGAAYNFAFGLAFLPLMLGRAILPRLAACKTVVALRAAYLRSAVITGLLAGGLSVLLVVAAPLFLSLYGAGFAGAQAPYLILIVAQGLFFFTHLNYMLIFARGRMRTGWALTLVALAVNLTANFLLIPPMGPSGAALAMVLSEAALLAAQVPTIRSLLGSSSDATTAMAGDRESAARAA